MKCFLAQLIFDFFRDAKNINVIDKLKNAGVNMEETAPEKESNSNIEGKTFVLTGTLSTGRSETAAETVPEEWFFYIFCKTSLTS